MKKRFYIPSSLFPSIAMQATYRKATISVSLVTSHRYRYLKPVPGKHNVYWSIRTSEILYALREEKDYPNGYPILIRRVDTENDGQKIALNTHFALLQTGEFHGEATPATLFLHPDAVPQEFDQYRR